MAVLITLDFYFTTLERNALNTTALSDNIWAIILNSQMRKEITNKYF